MYLTYVAISSYHSPASSLYKRSAVPLTRMALRIPSAAG